MSRATDWRYASTCVWSIPTSINRWFALHTARVRPAFSGCWRTLVADKRRRRQLVVVATRCGASAATEVAGSGLHGVVSRCRATSLGAGIVINGTRSIGATCIAAQRTMSRYNSTASEFYFRLRRARFDREVLRRAIMRYVPNVESMRVYSFQRLNTVTIQRNVVEWLLYFTPFDALVRSDGKKNHSWDNSCGMQVSN